MILDNSKPETPNPLIGGSDPCSELSAHIDALTIRCDSTRQFHQIAAHLARVIGPFVECHGNFEGSRHQLGMRHESMAWLTYSQIASERLWSFQITLKGAWTSTQTPAQIVSLVRHIQSQCEEPLKFTRVDLALDLKGHICSTVESPDDMVGFIHANDHWEPNPFRDVSARISKANGRTAYLGSMQSNQFVRYYDKGAQMNLPDPWYRWEHVWKKEKAQAVMEMLLDTRVDQTDSKVKTLACTIVNIHPVFPKLAEAIFVTQPDLNVERRGKCPLHAWTNHANTQYLNKVSAAASMLGIPPEEVAKRLGLFDLPPDYDLEKAVLDPRVVSIINFCYTDSE